MKLLALTILSIPCLTLAQAAAEPTARDQHAAQCVAALEVQTQDLAAQVKAGDEASRPVLFDKLTAGAAFVGDVYLHGNSDEKQARDLADKALEAQKSLTPAELAARQEACSVEGTKLFSASNSLQQGIVKHLAKRRMDKLLGA